MSSSRILHRDGSELSFEQLSGRVSASLFQTELHYDLCARVARLETSDEGVFKVLHNLLALKSRVLMGATALLEEAGREAGGIERVVLAPRIARAIGEELAARGIPVEQLPHDPPLLPRNVAVAFALKAVLHRLYRLAARPLRAGVPLVRAWVDVTDVMYGELYPRAQVRVYPFSFGFTRQLAYVRSLRARGVRWSFDGMPYRWRDAVVAVLPGGKRHLRLAQAEWLAYDRFAGELLAAGVREIHSSDEYEVGTVAAGERLRSGGAAYVNTAHGSGLYCPQIAYTRFEYLNDYQAQFYGRLGGGMELRKRAKPNSRLPFTRQDLEARQDLAVVYVHQNFEDYNLPSENEAQQAVVRQLGEVARQLGVAVVLKLHPNMPPERFKADLPDNLRVVGRWDELREWRPVFLTIYSTAYFELAQVAPVLVYSAPTYNPAVYLDGDFQTFTRADLAEKVAQLRDLGAWRSLVDRQLRTMGGAAA
jgi:hypothetical protein